MSFMKSGFCLREAEHAYVNNCPLVPPCNSICIKLDEKFDHLLLEFCRRCLGGDMAAAAIQVEILPSEERAAECAKRFIVVNVGKRTTRSDDSHHRSTGTARIHVAFRVHDRPNPRLHAGARHSRLQVERFVAATEVVPALDTFAFFAHGILIQSTLRRSLDPKNLLACET